ncbi:MAG: TadE-like protein [Pelotomaculum sp. PtaB.Bin013]|uniref:Pilus assembly protein n=1 Tax=Pelotomaculum isophthalicicum JI TaxID=947010 RepID=A0A9X4JWN0_9FIRM|nr:TadE family protein [Pelotomaculum isophthalicicum]MDF9409493.1 pilus assembly protein [Pelotomaculum isophthalicicum JI]OPX92209.1 MAG: TadE-like protein [Pelotomaculum sp. PtaB.Bin013]
MSTDSGRETRNTLIKDEKGVILVEFAFCFIILIVLFLGTVTLSFAFRDYVSLQRVVREGAREAVITGNTSMAYSKAYQAAWLWGLKPENLTITFQQEVDGNRTFEKCYGTYQIELFNYTFPALVGQASLSDININANATFGWWDFTKKNP